MKQLDANLSGGTKEIGGVIDNEQGNQYYLNQNL